MARARNIKPGFFKNEDLADLGPGGMCLFAGLWTLADKQGRLEDRPRRIKAELFPYFDFDVDGYLDALQERGFVVRYAVDGNAYLQIVNFLRHQRPHSNETESVIPACPGCTVLPFKGEPLSPKVESPFDQGEQGFVLIPDTGFTDSLIPSSQGGRGGDGADAPLRDAPTKKTSERRRRMPEDWTLSEPLRRYAVEWGIPDSEVDSVAEEFKLFWQGDGRPKANWDLTFQGRVRDVAPQYRGRASPNGSVSQATIDANIERIMSEVRENQAP